MGSSLFLQVTRITITAWMSVNFGRIPPLIMELAALERLKKKINNLVSNLAPSFLIGSSSFLQVRRTTIISRTSSKPGMIRLHTAELAALERLKNSHILIMEKNLVSTLAPLFLIGSSSFLQVTRTTIKASMSLNFGGIPPLISKLAALERLKSRTVSLLAL